MMSYVAAHAGRMCVKSSSNHGCHRYWLTPTSTHTHHFYRPFSFAQNTGTWHQKNWNCASSISNQFYFYGFWYMFKIVQEELMDSLLITCDAKNTRNYCFYTDVVLVLVPDLFPTSDSFLGQQSRPGSSTKMQLVRKWELVTSGIRGWVLLSPRQQLKDFNFFLHGLC